MSAHHSNKWLRDRVAQLEKQLDALERRARTLAAELVEKNAQLQELEAPRPAVLK